MRKKKRCTQVLMTNEARVLKELRVKKGLSMVEAGFRINRSDSYISHLENGRMDIPNNGQLSILLNVYGISHESFQKLVVSFEPKTSNKEKLIQMVSKLNDRKIAGLLSLVERSLEEGSSTLEVAI